MVYSNTWIEESRGAVWACHALPTGLGFRNPATQNLKDRKNSKSATQHVFHPKPSRFRTRSYEELDLEGLSAYVLDGGRSRFRLLRGRHDTSLGFRVQGLGFRGCKGTVCCSGSTSGPYKRSASGSESWGVWREPARL